MLAVCWGHLVSSDLLCKTTIHAYEVNRHAGESSETVNYLSENLFTFTFTSPPSVSTVPGVNVDAGCVLGPSGVMVFAMENHNTCIFILQRVKLIDMQERAVRQRRAGYVGKLIV